MSDQDQLDLLRSCGLLPLGRVRSAELPSPMRAWHVTASGNLDKPTAAVPLSAPRLSARVDAEWLRLAHQHDIIDGHGVFLIDLPGPSPHAWTSVRLTDHARLAEHLVGDHALAGQAEFVTMAADGSAMCGVTTEEHDVWLIAETEALHAPPPPLPDLATLDLDALHPMQINRWYSPERLRHPYRDSLVLLGFHRTHGKLARLHEIPDGLACTLAHAEYSGLVPIADSQAEVLGEVLGAPIDTARLAYYLEHQTGITKSEQTTARRLPT